MDLTEKKLSGELKYTGVIVSVTLDKVELCDGHQTLREVVHHPGGVGVLPLDTDGNVYMVRQFRYPVGAPVLEIPAGKIDHHDKHLTTAVRELSEETGFSADEYIDLGCCYRDHPCLSGPRSAPGQEPPGRGRISQRGKNAL